MLPAPQLPVMLSIFAQSPDQAHLKELKAEYDFLSRVFYNRRDYRHVNLFEVEASHVIETIQTYAKDLQILHFGGHADGK